MPVGTVFRALLTRALLWKNVIRRMAGAGEGPPDWAGRDPPAETGSCAASYVHSTIGV